MSFLLGVVIFVVALLISIMLHEAGHFLTAKKFGMKATQFFVGFGQTLWSTQRGETEYGIKALPLGGFVRITGMTTLDEVDPADEPRSFRNKPRWQRAIVLVAGSFMHFAIAFVLLIVLALGIGQANSNTTTIGSVASCVPASAKALDQGSCKNSQGSAPAMTAGIKANDKIIAIGGKPVHTWAGLGTAIRAQPAGQPVPVTVLRDGKQLHLSVTPADVPGRHGSYLGIGEALVFQRISPLRAVTFAGSAFGQVLVDSAQAVAKLPAAVPDLFAKDRSKTPAGNVSSVVGVANIAGQVVEARRRMEDHRLGPAADHYLAEYLHRRVQPAAAAAAGRRPPRGHLLRAGQGLVRPDPRQAGPRPGRHAAADPGQRRRVRTADRAGRAADGCGHL